MCLLCFCQDTFQYNLRNISQLQSNSFEHTLSCYKKNFISHYIEKRESPLCEIHKGYTTLATRLCEISTDEIESIFEAIKEIYIYWLNSHTTEAQEKLSDLFTKYDILQFKGFIENEIFFRGRLSCIPLTEWDMFHIPFNKRYLIRNQRYSLGGQPILYLSYSPFGVFNEINIDIDSNQQMELNLSTFHFRKQNSQKNILKFFNYLNNIDIKSDLNTVSFKVDSTTKIYDNKDKLNDYVGISDKINHILVTDDDNGFTEENLVKQVKNTFILMLLASCCCFSVHKTIKEPFFVEEYVLPQLVAQYCNEKKFEGIIYSSCKPYYTVGSKIPPLLSNYISKTSNNLALFTTYTSDDARNISYVYDKPLYNALEISSPFFVGSYDNSFELEVIRSEFISFSEEYSSSSIRTKLSGIDINKKIMLLQHIRFILDYFDTYFSCLQGKLHILMLYNLILVLKAEALYSNIGGV